METRKNLIAEFLQKFRKTQRNGVITLPLYVPLLIIAIIIECGLEWYIIHSGVQNPLTHSNDGFEILAFITFAGIPLLLLYSTTIFFPSEFFETYNIFKQQRRINENLAEFKKRKAISERRCRILKSKLDDINKVTSTSKYIFNIVKSTQKIIEENETYYQWIINRISVWEAELDAYNKIDEKNFWQYVWSCKWIKRQET